MQGEGIIAEVRSQIAEVNVANSGRSSVFRDMASEWERRQAKEISKAILGGELSVLEGTRALRPLAHTDAIPSKEDRTLIIAIESETDHLPVGEVRKLWSPSVLVEKDVEIARCETLWREKVFAACRRMLDI